jgi:DNA repair protein RadC
MKSDRIKNWPARERPRERLIAEGPERLTDAELLAIVLRVGRGTFKAGVSGQSATELARQLLAEFKGWRGLDRAFIGMSSTTGNPAQDRSDGEREASTDRRGAQGG